MTIYQECQADTEGDAEEAHQGIEQSGRSGNIVFGRNVSYAIGERDSRNERYDSADDDVAQMADTVILIEDGKVVSRS